jgi:hypothetical protein
MDTEDLKELIRDVLRSERGRRAAPRATRKPLEYQKRLMLFASAVYAAVLAVCVVSWFMYRELPIELLRDSTGLYGAAFACYSGKAALENKSKIEKEGVEQ